MKPTIKLDSVSVEFPIYDPDRSLRRIVMKNGVGGLIRNDSSTGGRTTIQALSNINLEMYPGDSVGLVGPNGAGKSTLLQVLAGGYHPSGGVLETNGTVSSLLTLGVGIDPEETGYENIMTSGLYLGLSRRQMRAIIPDIAEFCELGQYLYMPVRTYSSGMSVRLSFAIATSIRPDILIVDEIIGAGDAKFASKAHNRIEKLMSSANTLVLASHSNDVIRTFCNKALYLDKGKVQFFGDVDEAIDAYEQAG
ncbi:MAG: ABC transporter ATP-binding protein [Parvibaculaceae bacterium]|nr:ABC transporter ATP-binding protein [Parvibaculaceae bacterium]HBM89903.1 ABC transporter ATP-binding protein [Rhodobiaceae bacterium]